MLFTDKTVFVLGAGASYELGMPLGVELKEQMGEHLKKRVEKESIERDIDLKKALTLSASIDNLLEARKDQNIRNRLKSIMVRVLLMAERHSIISPPQNEANPLVTKPREKECALDDSWLLSFFQYLVGGGVDKLRENIEKLNVINFNYDRCLETFLEKSEKDYFGEERFETSKLVQFRPYGTLEGEFGLPNKDLFDTPDDYLPDEVTQTLIPRGDAKFIESAWKNITTFSEPANDLTKRQVRETLANAQSIIFLGFAFHPQNMEYLDPRQAGLTNRQNPAIYATAYGMSKPAAAQIQSELMAMFNAKPDHVHVRNDLTCAKLMQEYGRPPYQFTPS